MPSIDTSDDATGGSRKVRQNLDASVEAPGSGDEFMGLDFTEMFKTKAVQLTTNRHAQRVRLYGAWAVITPAVITCGYLLVQDKPYHAALMFLGTALLVGFGILVNPPVITIRPMSENEQEIHSARPGEWGSPEDYQTLAWNRDRNRQDRRTDIDE